MNISKNTMVLIAFAIAVILFLYFGGGTMFDGENNRMMHENGLMGDKNWGWFPGIVILLLGVLIGWLIFKKKN